MFSTVKSMLAIELRWPGPTDTVEGERCLPSMHIVEQSEAGGSRYGRLAAMVAESESETEEGQTTESGKGRTPPLLPQGFGCESLRDHYDNRGGLHLRHQGHNACVWKVGEAPQSR